MIQPREQVELQPFNTLALPSRARWFAEVRSVEELAAAAAWATTHDVPLLLLGGGSNVVLAGDWPGLAVRMASAGKRVVADEGETVLIEVAAGENWHALVQWTLAQGFEGLENLTLIPGTVGAAPVQNIGAYGVELASCLVSVRGWSLVAGREEELPAAACELAYRDSIFKHALRDRFVITSITLRLSRHGRRVTDYPALREALLKLGIEPSRASAVDVERAVRQVRQSKLPDPDQLPNAGSFFKNPLIPHAQYQALRRQWPALPSYAAGPGQIKVPAGWLVEQAGWKGKRRGAVGVHAEQALVLVHFGGGTGADVLALAAAIQADVQARFGIALEIEPRLYGDVTAAVAKAER